MTQYWVWLGEVLGRGSAKLPAVLSCFGSPKALFDAQEQQVCTCGIFSDRELAAIRQHALAPAQATVERCRQIGCTILTPDMAAYPKRLLTIPDPPCALYLRGTLPDLDNEVAVTVVGPRNATDKGVRAAASLAARLTVSGCVIVTGAARGIDCAALQGAVAAFGKPISIVPCGPDSDYPNDTLTLRNDIVKLGGCVLSECPPGTRYGKGAFHTRNRILAGLSQATVVVEAAAQSGALITAGCAATQGRDVFVIPGEIHSPAHVGSNALLQDGARPLLEAADILLEYVNTYPHKLNLIAAKEPFSDEIRERLRGVLRGRKPSKNQTVKHTSHAADEKPRPTAVQKRDTSALNETARAVLQTLEGAALPPDLIADRTGLAVGQVLTALIELELLGFVRSLPGGRFELAD